MYHLINESVVVLNCSFYSVMRIFKREHGLFFFPVAKWICDLLEKSIS